MSKFKVLELFAGVGGFRVGLEKCKDNLFETLWANQYEPNKKKQEAFEVYDYHYPQSENLNIDIAEITNEQFAKMDVDIIVGGFPCQDYSVARSKKNELGIEGKKGVLFWEIARATSVIKPKHLILENVDRLLIAPSKQRGRDFAIMLSTFYSLGYSVEWRVINASEYGWCQRRRRVFILCTRNDLMKEPFQSTLNKAFPIQDEEYIPTQGNVSVDIAEVSSSFRGQFYNYGYMIDGVYTTYKVNPILEEPITLGQMVQEEVDEKYFITDDKKIEKFNYLRGAKKIERVNADGHKYVYSEGGMSPYDSFDLPARTMLTSEGSVNRSTHLLKIGDRYRFLTPVEAERLQGFDDDWTKYKKTENGVEEVSDRSRMFFMGNALVTEVVRRIGEVL